MCPYIGHPFLVSCVCGGGGTRMHLFTGRARCHYHTASSTIQLAGLAISLGILRLLDSTAHILPAPTVSFANGKCLTHLCGQEVSPGPPMHPDCTQTRGKGREASAFLGLHPDCHLTGGMGPSGLFLALLLLLCDMDHATSFLVIA